MYRGRDGGEKRSGSNVETGRNRERGEVVSQVGV
jgi:hypothetical protein